MLPDQSMTERRRRNERRTTRTRASRHAVRHDPEQA